LTCPPSHSARSGTSTFPIDPDDEALETAANELGTTTKRDTSAMTLPMEVAVW
jgi:Arc/MetJ family transcription regulator